MVLQVGEHVFFFPPNKPSHLRDLAKTSQIVTAVAPDGGVVD